MSASTDTARLERAALAGDRRAAIRLHELADRLEDDRLRRRALAALVRADLRALSDPPADPSGRTPEWEQIVLGNLDLPLRALSPRAVRVLEEIRQTDGLALLDADDTPTSTGARDHTCLGVAAHLDEGWPIVGLSRGPRVVVWSGLREDPTAVIDVRDAVAHADAGERQTSAFRDRVPGRPTDEEAVRSAQSGLGERLTVTGLAFDAAATLLLVVFSAASAVSTRHALATFDARDGTFHGVCWLPPPDVDSASGLDLDVGGRPPRHALVRWPTTSDEPTRPVLIDLSDVFAPRPSMHSPPGARLSPDSSRIAAASSQGVGLYDPRSGTCELILQTPMSATSVVFDPSGTYVVARFGVRGVRAWWLHEWKLDDGDPARARLAEIGAPPLHLDTRADLAVMHPTLPLVLLVDRDGSYTLHDISSGDAVETGRADALEGLDEACFSDDGAALVTRRDHDIEMLPLTTTHQDQA